MPPLEWGKTMNENTDKPAIYIMKNVDSRLWYWEGKNDRPEEHMLEALSEESLEKAIVAIRAQLAEMIETRSSNPTKLLIQPGLLKELGYTVEDVVKMVEEHIREHIDSETCWCKPEVDYTDPDTGVSVYVHRKTQ
jgi:hypothetical protein